MGRPIDHALPPKLLARIYEAGWSHETEFAWWRKSLLEARRELRLTDDNVIAVLAAFDSAPREELPSTMHIWYSGKRYPLSRPLVLRAIGRDAKPSGRKASAPASDTYGWTEDDLRADMKAGTC